MITPKHWHGRRKTAVCRCCRASRCPTRGNSDSSPTRLPNLILHPAPTNAQPLKQSDFTKKGGSRHVIVVEPHPLTKL